jgi:hypothetical protein
MIKSVGGQGSVGPEFDTELWPQLDCESNRLDDSSFELRTPETIRKSNTGYIHMSGTAR